MKKLTVLAALIIATMMFFCFDGLHQVSANGVDADADGILDTEDLCLGTAIPEGVPWVRLGTNRWALVNGGIDFDTTSPRGKGPGLSFTIVDTAGCSCEQIIDALGLGKGHSKFGCSISAMEDWIASIEVPLPECSDGIDNDADEAIDYPDDTGCDSPEDDNEAFEECPPGFEDCDQAPQNGCETNIFEDELHCGECNSPCGGNCVGGFCNL